MRMCAARVRRSGSAGAARVRRRLLPPHQGSHHRTSLPGLPTPGPAQIVGRTLGKHDGGGAAGDTDCLQYEHDVTGHRSPSPLCAPAFEEPALDSLTAQQRSTKVIAHRWVGG